MKNKLKVGTRIKQVKPIEEYGFNYVGEEFMIIDIKDDVIIFECVFGKGGIDKEKIDEYFTIINEDGICKKFLKTVMKRFK
ncbi:hypothetical protein QB607_003082 [Clostridium botulinum]|nr:hypothetical protein [Clostridium botulinum]EKS4395755.1 hypothetical protein [Clostridium botulinum]